MSKLYLTTCFHGNLGYSSIPEEKYPEVIKKCYWPFLSLAEKLDIKLGFEFPAKTLEIIQKLDKNLLQKIKQLWEENRIEVIGSGYVQSIFPLILVEVNKKNLEIGNKIYKKLLGRIPEIAFVNEHAYSKGLVRLYKEVGYKAIIIDWINALKSNPKLKKCKFSATKIKGVDNENINVIWNNSILFQKLQRYIYGDLTKEDYLKFIKSNYSNNENRCLMIYGNDMEIFDFRPRDPKTLHSGGIIEPEIKKIEEIFRELKNSEAIEFILPSQIFDITFINKIYDVCSAEYPIITKKQDKYNAVRWAVCGRNNYITNSLCYKAYKLLLEYEKQHGYNEEKWKKLVEFWASDFRTHTEIKKWKTFRNELNKFIDDLTYKLDREITNADKVLREIEIKNGTVETDTILLKLSEIKGGTVKELVFKKISDLPLIRTIPPEYFEDATYSVDLFSGHTIIFDEDKQKTDLSKTGIKAVEMADRIKATCQNSIDNSLKIIKEYHVYKNIPKVELTITFESDKEIKPAFVRTGIVTLNPEAFDKNTLYYSTKNGGYDKETYLIKNNFDQTLPIDLRITAKHCLGTTNEELEIGDKKKRLLIKTDKSKCYSVPLLKFEKLNDSFVLRVLNSIIEKDETSNISLTGKNKIIFSYEAFKK